MGKSLLEISAPPGAALSNFINQVFAYVDDFQLYYILKLRLGMRKIERVECIVEEYIQSWENWVG